MTPARSPVPAPLKQLAAHHAVQAVRLEHVRPAARPRDQRGAVRRPRLHAGRSPTRHGRRSTSRRTGSSRIGRSSFTCSGRCRRWKAATWSAKRTRSSSSTRSRVPARCPTSRARSTSSSLLVDRLRLSGVDRALLHPRGAPLPAAARAREDRLHRRRAAPAGDADLVAFLRNFKTGTEVFALADPLRFVDELSSRWQARVRQAPAPAAVEAPVMDPGAVFISYASEDRPAAEALRTALDAGRNGCLVRSRSPVCRRRLRVAHPAQHRALLAVHRRPVEVVRHARSPLLPPRVGSGAARRGNRARVGGVHPAGSRRRSAATITSSSPRSSASCTGRRSAAARWIPAFVDRVKQLYREHQSRTVRADVKEEHVGRPAERHARRSMPRAPGRDSPRSARRTRRSSRDARPSSRRWSAW